MSPYDHALLSVRDFGGKVEDYLPIHEFLDQTKLHVSHNSHRLFLHNTLGIQIAEQLFGPQTGNVATREVARKHILQDCQKVPALTDILILIKQGNLGILNNPNKEDLKWLKKHYEDTK